MRKGNGRKKQMECENYNSGRINGTSKIDGIKLTQSTKPNSKKNQLYLNSN